MTMQQLDNLVQTNSYLIPRTWMTPDDIQGHIFAAYQAALQAAVTEMGNGNFVSRALFASDFGAISTNTWTETTSGSTWATTAFADGSQVLDNIFIGIYGCKFLYDEIADGLNGGFDPVVTGIRLQTGGARVAQWDLNVIYQSQMSAATVANVYGGNTPFVTGIASSPVVMTQNKGATVQFLERTTGLDFNVPLLGVVVEPVGGGGAALVP